MNEGHLRGRKDKALMQGMLQWAKMLQKVYGVCLCPGKKTGRWEYESLSSRMETNLADGERRGGTLWGL